MAYTDANSYTGGYETYNTGEYRYADMAGLTLPEGAHEISQRKISSVVVQSQQLEKTEPEVRYVEVPVIEEVTRHVPVKQVKEVVTRIPKIEIEYVDRQVEVPQIEYRDCHVEVERIQEVVRHVTVPQVVERAVDVVKHVPKVEVRQVEKIVEVPGQTIEVPKPYTVENHVPFSRYHDEEQPLIVAQTVAPIIVEANEQLEVDVVAYEPECVPVDIHVGKLVNACLIPGATETCHRVVTVPSSQYNTMLRYLNGHLSTKELEVLPYMEEHNQVAFMQENLNYITPPAGAAIEGLVAGGIYSTGVPTRIAGRATTHNVPAVHTTAARTTVSHTPHRNVTYVPSRNVSRYSTALSPHALGPVVTQTSVREHTGYSTINPYNQPSVHSTINPYNQPSVHASLPMHGAR